MIGSHSIGTALAHDIVIFNHMMDNIRSHHFQFILEYICWTKRCFRDYEKTALYYNYVHVNKCIVVEEFPNDVKRLISTTVEHK